MTMVMAGTDEVAGGGQLDSSSICFWWQGGETTTAAVGDVEVKGGGSNTIN